MASFRSVAGAAAVALCLAAAGTDAAASRLRRAVPAALVEQRRAVALAAEELPVTMVEPILLETGQIPTRGCRNCRMDDEPAVQLDAEDPAQMAEWAKHTTRRAHNAMDMMESIEHMPSSMVNQQDKDIAEDRHLLDLADKLKDKLSDVLGAQGIQVNLPSEHPTFTDATGMHWEEAHLWDDTDNLNIQQYQDTKKDRAALKAEIARVEVPQWHGSSTNNRLINEANPLRPLVVHKLAAGPPCEGTSCVKVKTVPLLPERREQVQADTASL